MWRLTEKLNFKLKIMNITQIEENLQKIVKSFKKETFVFDLLLAYGVPKSTIKKLEGGLNLSKVIGEIIWKKKLFYKLETKQDIHKLIAIVKADPKTKKHSPRFILITDNKTLLAYDTKTTDSLDIPILEIAKHFDFLLPLVGMEKAQHQNENPADVKAAEKMAKLYDEIKKDNPTKTHAEVHNLNVFLSRLLFCFFAEDTGIFDKGQFTLGIGSHTQLDGSDLNSYLDKLFEVMNTEHSKRKKLPAYLEAFDYVNGGLFRNKHHAPIFTRRSRQAIIDSGELDWSAINPDIFGSMIQAVITPEHRGGLGMHYTSVPNIMKVIEPLFLNDLHEEFEAAKGNAKKLNTLLKRIGNIKIFDPACGSGNFLIIAYKELRRLEIKIFKSLNTLALSNISLGNFYGIELDDFAHEVAILSLWLAEHQMNQEFFKEFGRTKPALPLKETGNIVHGNATRLSWEKVCPKNEADEIYILGNPPYLGARLQSDEQKEDMAIVFKNKEGFNNLDYISCWFFKGKTFIESCLGKYAFVTTNSICQGTQVPLLWMHLLDKKTEIDFAYQSFKWKNNAKANAGVTVMVIGIRNISKAPKFIYNNNIKNTSKNISPFITDSDNIYVHDRRESISKLPEMTYGSMPNEGGFLILTEEEKNELLRENKLANKYLKKFTGAAEFIDSVNKFCIWINESEFKDAMQIESIRKRIDLVKKYRLESKRAATNKLAAKPFQFGEVRYKNTTAILVPQTTSENREYIPIGLLPAGTVISNAARIIYDATYWLFAVLNSKMHMVWVTAVAGRLETRIQYSNSLCYNTFPIPFIDEEKRKELESLAMLIIERREEYSEKTLAQLYDMDKMPVSLREAHHQLDLAIEKCYRSKPFESDEERLEYLFKLYKQMAEEEKSKGTLFDADSKTKKKKK
jgi:hypothetical protein